MVSAGYQFNTGNSVVAGLPVGAELVVVGNGRLEVASVPQKSLNPGDRFQSKYGPATVLSPSSRFGEIDGFDPEEQVLYLADGTTVVRVTSRWQ